MSSLNRYQLLRAVATGGMAQVYEAVAEGEAGFERRVAIKRVLPEFLEDDRQRRMFIDEARIASRLYHSNIVQVLDYGVVDDGEFLVMEYIDGIDASRACRQAETKEISFPETVSLHIVAEVALALDYAHCREDENGDPMGIVHRDVSPQNLLLSWDGDVKLSDFGIAKAHVRQERTATGLIKGKEAYMSPEQAAAREVSPATDIFALGVTLHVMLAGFSPFKYGTPIDPDHKAQGISAEVNDLIDRCLSVDPGERPTASAVAERANALRSRRTEATGRHELAEWLKTLRDAAPTRDAFSELLSAYLVQKEPGSHVYSITRSSEELAAKGQKDHVLGEEKNEPSAPIEETLAVVPPGATSELAAGGRGPQVKKGQVLPLALVLLLLGASAFAGLWWLRGDDDRHRSTGRRIATTSAPSLASPVLVQLDASSLAEEPRGGDAAGATPPLEAGPAIPSDAASMPSPTKDPPRRPRRRPADDSESPPAAETPTAIEGGLPPELPSETSTAWLRVGGQSLRRAAIEIDGRPVGHAPLERSLKVGSYRLVARDAESRAVLLDTRIKLSEHHRRTSPLRIIR